LASAGDYLAAVWSDNPSSPADEAPSAPPPAARDSSAAVSAGPRALSPTDPANAPLGRLNGRLVSRTDPDAALVARDKVPPGLYYKVHGGVDGGAARLITAVEVTSGEIGDEQLLARLVREHAGATGRAVAEVVADTKYGTQANYLALDAAGIRASIQPCPGGGVRRVLGRELFAYEPAADRYRCPAGEPMRRMGRTRTGTPLGGIQYRADPRTCRACRLKPDCCGTAAARTITRPEDDGLFERVRAHLATAQSKRSRRRRACWVETANAELKEHHGLRRAQCRGRASVQMQAYGAAIAYDVKKLAAGIRCRRVPAAEARPRRSSPSRHHRVPLSARTPRLPSRHFGNRPCSDQ
jgi:transposase